MTFQTVRTKDQHKSSLYNLHIITQVFWMHVRYRCSYTSHHVGHFYGAFLSLKAPGHCEDYFTITKHLSRSPLERECHSGLKMKWGWVNNDRDGQGLIWFIWMFTLTIEIILCFSLLPTLLLLTQSEGYKHWK